MARLPLPSALRARWNAWRETPWASRLLNPYVVVSLAFGVYMLFFDAYNVFEKASLSRELRQAREDKAYYRAEIERTKRRLDELLLDERTAEKFAREQYLMKREDEDVFVILEAPEGSSGQGRR